MGFSAGAPASNHCNKLSNSVGISLGGDAGTTKVGTWQTHHVETTLCECGILVMLFSTWYQRGNHVIACLVYDVYNNMAK